MTKQDVIDSIKGLVGFHPSEQFTTVDAAYNAALKTRKLDLSKLHVQSHICTILLRYIREQK